jgi:ribosomal protein L40E
MDLDNEYNNGISFDKICPKCGVGNPDEADNCIVCDKDLEETMLFFEDEFYDIELTNDSFIEYRKNFYKTRRTGKVKIFNIDKMEKIRFGHPITRFTFNYNGKKEVYALKAENYRSLKYLMINIGKFEE